MSRGTALKLGAAPRLRTEVDLDVHPGLLSELLAASVDSVPGLPLQSSSRTLRVGTTALGAPFCTLGVGVTTLGGLRVMPKNPLTPHTPQKFPTPSHY